ncbi:MAG: LVIVD repeat-containing protein [Microvirga sp.]
MAGISRRQHLRQLGGVLGAGALAGVAPSALAADPEIPPEGLAKGVKHISYCDIGGRPDSVQVMASRNHLYVGHMFSDGLTVLDASNPRELKPVGFFTAGQYTRTHHLQVSGDHLLLANGANIVAMQSYDTMRGYFENALADSITNRKKFRSGLSIHDISKPAELREIAFLEMPGFGINRLWWSGGRHAYVSAHFDGFTDHILCIVDLNDVTKPEIVSKWWLPGMNRAAGEESRTPKGKRHALHHMITAGDRGYGAWRDGGFTIHDIKDPANPKLLSHINWSPPFPGGTHTPLPLPGRGLAVVADEANAERCAKGTFHTFVVDVRAPENPVPISTLPSPRERDFCQIGTFGPHNLHENRPGSFQSEETIFATYNVAGVRVFDIKDAFAPKEVAYWVPPVPKKLVDPRPNIALAAKTCDCYVTPEGLMYVTDWNAGLHVLEYFG